MLDFLKIHENTRCLLAGFQRPKLRKYLYIMMEVFKIARRKELQEAVRNAQIPDQLEDTLNEYIMDTEPDDFSIQRTLFEKMIPSGNILPEDEILFLTLRRKVG